LGLPEITSVAIRAGNTIGGGAYWTGRATAAHFSVLVGKAYSLPAHFFVVENLIFVIIQQRHGL